MQTRSNNINEIAEAIALAQQAISNPKKDSKNPFFKSTYADLPSILTMLRDILPEYGLSFSQPIEMINEKPFLVTLIMHKSGQWIKSYCPIISKDATDPQKFGSAVTYMRRYALQSIIGIAGDDDDDGNSASHKSAPISDEDMIRDFLDRWGQEYGKGALIEFVRARAEHLKIKERPIVKMYSSKPEGFKKDFEAWLAKKNEEEQDEDA